MYIHICFIFYVKSQIFGRRASCKTFLYHMYVYMYTSYKRYFYAFYPTEDAPSCISKVSFFLIIRHRDPVNFLFSNFLNITCFLLIICYSVACVYIYRYIPRYTNTFLLTCPHCAQNSQLWKKSISTFRNVIWKSVRP